MRATYVAFCTIPIATFIFGIREKARQANTESVYDSAKRREGTSYIHRPVFTKQIAYRSKLAWSLAAARRRRASAEIV